ncbi:MAG: DUF3488 domain-containing transglutaminase family protein [Betaproteobacteria bacterium]|nr:DUF3488 domain-containing transglutaminase family protein [Betaproteobacteria bacterium]
MLNQGALTLANITWLLAAMAFVIAPHVTRLPIWVSAVCVGAGLARWWIARRGLRTPPWWIMAMLAVAVAAGALVEYRQLIGREVGVTLLIAMLCLKVLEMRMKRDVVIAIFLGFFLAMTNFLYSQTILMGLYMLACVWIFVATLVGFNRINTEATVRERLVPAFWLLIQAIPLMLVLFFLFPRLSGPLWRMPGADSAGSGLSDEMSPGDISKLSLSDAVAFRVDFDAAVPETQDLYWRGPVLGRQVGRSWKMYPVRAAPRIQYDALSPPVKYRVTLQPSNKPWLFALDLPAAAPPEASILGDFQLRSFGLVTSLRSYEMSSHLRYRVGTDLPPEALRPYLQYNEDINPRTIAYAKKLREDNPDPKVLIEKLMARYNSEFEYTLEPPRLGLHPVDEFLFDTKKGFCEHYAGSFVLILRAAGIPARVVTGYQGGEVNPISRQLVVRQSEAHAWSEVWLEDLGWVRADPTFAVSPLRINRGMTEALGPQGVLNGLIQADRFGLLKQIGFTWDAVNSQWNQWVVGFNQERQRFAFESWLGVRDMDWRQLAIWLIVGMVSSSGVVGLILLMKIYRTRTEPVVAAYARFCAKLAKAGVSRAPSEGPMDLLSRLARERPALAVRARPVLEAYVALRYAP